MMTCPVCQHEVSLYVHPVTRILFYQCFHCELMFKDPKHYPTPDDEKKRYLSHQNNLSDEGYVRFLMDFIDRAIKPYAVHHLLDYGCGPSPVLQSILKQTYDRVDGYDPFFYPMKPDHRYDMIMATEVLEHLHHPMETLHDMHQLMKPQGYLSIMTLFRPYHPDDFNQWFYIRDTTHVMFYTPKTLEIIASLMKWDLIDCDQKRIAVFQKK